jgi:thiamine-phosphate pyrophosphorylase
MPNTVRQSRKIDLRLYAIVDPEQAGSRSLPDLARLVVAGGATLVQLRDKLRDTRVLVEEARALRAVLAPLGVPLVINDRVDVALAAGVDGVHVGQDDMTVEDVRRLMGPDVIVGLSIKTVAQAEAAPIALIDYAGVGAVFATGSKDIEGAPIGTAGLAAVMDILRRRAPAMPVCGISGINAGNAAEVIDAGADGVSVISALSRQSDPTAAATTLRGVVDRALAKKTAAGRGAS